jgi:asparagine synthase (glutamine-hydrolysing)
MCGISGISNYKTGRPVEPSCLRLMTDLISHRGPDGEGHHIDCDLGLGHRRLSIIDLEGGRQPMSNEDGTVWIVFNGEIYNYPSLRNELESHGHKFRTNSDTEAIVHLYEHAGESCFEHLRGMFAIALWDAPRRKLLLARDRLGIKPLFYGLGHDGVVFGSEIKCLVASGLLRMDIEPTAIADLFAFFYIPGPKTIYRNIFSLHPGNYLRIDRTGVHQFQYWDIKEGQLMLPGERQYEERLLQILTDSVRCHLLSDVPVGAFLSGGVDSGAVTALMSELVGKGVMTCTIGFDEQGYDEMGRARTIAGILGTAHSELKLRPDPIKILEKLVHFYDQPFPDHSAVPTYYVSELARKRVKVVLSGDGGDENFAGYSRYRRHLTLERLRHKVPAVLLRPFRSRGGSREKGNFRERIVRVLHQTALEARDGYIHGITIADAALRQRLFSPDLNRQLADYDPMDRFRDIYDRAPAKDFLSKASYLDLKTYLVDDILTKVDRASMANSLEVRVPLLDHQLVEFAFAVPEQMKVREDRGKYLLRKVASRFLPENYLNAPKMGFRVPMEPWMQGELRTWTESVIFSRSAEPYLNFRGVRQIWDWFQQGRTHLGDCLGILQSFALSAPLWNTTQSFETSRPDIPIKAVSG